jgi:hypothetical protein
MDNPEESKSELEENVRRCATALHLYCENRSNPMDNHPQFVKLVDEFFAAKDALASAE